MSKKTKTLFELARRRRASSLPGYFNLHEFHNGTYDCDFVSPYSLGAGNVDTAIFVVLQDWVSADYLVGEINNDLVNIGRDPKLPTNKTLSKLLKRYFNQNIEDVFATNLFPFIKPGGMSTTIANKDLRFAAERFAWPQIFTVKPRLVIALGLNTFNALRHSQGFKRVSRMHEAIESPFTVKGFQVWCQAHTGGMGQATRNRGRVDRVTSDWQKMERWYSSS
ncbi:MAG: hypothetical protein AAGA30_14240 [Planctomycetota bacterium]